MRVIETSLADVRILEPKVFGDDRGHFMETWNVRTFAELGLEIDFVQDNQSRSARGVLRGIHYQLHRPQGKLVRVVTGRVFDVAIDLRRSSPTLGKWVGVELSGENRRMLWIPPGFGHAFLALEHDTTFLYKCTEFYAPDDERCIRWDDPEIGIDWPQMHGTLPMLSQKDLQGHLLADAEIYP